MNRTLQNLRAQLPPWMIEWLEIIIPATQVVLILLVAWGVYRLLRRLERGEFDLVAVGRALLSDPEWVVKVREGRTSELKDFERSHMAELY